MITIKINWVNNRTWGMNPHARLHNDTTGDYITARRSGCGYDKLSAVIADVLNKDTEIQEKLSHKYYKNAPYGVYKDRGIDGGIGINSITTILKWLGYKIEHNSYKQYDFIAIYEK